MSGSGRGVILNSRTRTERLPFLKLFTVGSFFYAADHEICQMAVFVSNYIEKPILQNRITFRQFQVQDLSEGDGEANLFRQ